VEGRALRKADRVAHELLVRVVSGQLTVGALLPKEAELCEEFGVNRSVVREAIKLLEVHQLVRPVKRRGTEILDPLASLSHEVLRAMLRPEPGRVDQRVLRDLLEIRAQLDIEMSALAAERRTEADLERMEDCLATLRTELDDARRYAWLINDLAHIVAQATQNRIYQMLVHWHRLVYADLEDLFQSVRLANAQHLQGLELFIELIRRKDPESVRSVVKMYHEWATPRIKAAAALASGEPLDKIMEMET
jgi:DNA-binding FadR family transcriptional regulator